MRNVRYSTIVVLMAIASTAAAAPALMTGPETLATYPGCDTSMTPDECMWSPMAGGNYQYCGAFGKLGEQCVDRHPTTRECIGVWRDGRCYCDTTTLKGTCKYTP